ncbi:MAG TPA: SDR family oxidoreductase [Actinomycetota bacterium]|nr:SDR family oxidoreductase [Actinomycetota bacterium]
MIAGRVIVVTGASSGLGANLALALGARGAELVLAARRKERLDAIAARVRESGGTALVVPTDVTLKKDLEHLVQATADAHGRIDVLVNNAGIPGGGRFSELTLAEIEKVTSTDYLSVLRLTKLFLPMLLDSRGQIVNVASLAGRFAVPGAGAYTAAKHAVVALSESLYHELGPEGVMVTVVNPGFFETEGFPHEDLKGHPLSRLLVSASGDVLRSVVEVIDGRRGPEVSVPRWLGAMQAFRVLTPPLYRAGVRRFTTQRLRRPPP